MPHLDIRRPDLRGPSHLGELLASGPCTYDPDSRAITTADLAPPLPINTIEEVMLYIDNHYVGFVVLDHGALISNMRDPSPWFAL
jgi:hypothetical protein